MIDQPAPQLGLPRSVVEVVPYQAGWVQAFEHAKSDILDAAEGIELQIEHIGSTSVPGLEAKPIVDIAVLLEGEGDFGRFQRGLASIGWIYRGDKGPGRGGRLFVRESEPELRTHHLHAYFRGAPDWERYLRFRDTLRGNRRLREQYGQLKTALAVQYREDRMSYMTAKSDFVSSVLNRRR